MCQLLYYNYLLYYRYNNFLMGTMLFQGIRNVRISLLRYCQYGNNLQHLFSKFILTNTINSKHTPQYFLVNEIPHFATLKHHFFPQFYKAFTRLFPLFLQENIKANARFSIPNVRFICNLFLCEDFFILCAYLVSNLLTYLLTLIW